MRNVNVIEYYSKTNMMNAEKYKITYMNESKVSRARKIIYII